MPEGENSMTRIELLEAASMKLAEAVILLAEAAEQRLAEIAGEMAEIVEFRAATLEGQLLSAAMEDASRLMPWRRPH